MTYRYACLHHHRMHLEEWAKETSREVSSGLDPFKRLKTVHGCLVRTLYFPLTSIVMTIISHSKPNHCVMNISDCSWLLGDIV